MSRRALLLFAALGVIWGIPYLLIKVAVRDVTPATLVFLRCGIGAAVLLPLAAARGELRPALRRWPAVVAFAAAEIAVPFLFLPSAERTLPSSVTGLLVAAVPLAGIPIAWAFRRPQHLGTSGVAGVLVGLAGVAALVGFDLPRAELSSAALLAFVVVGYALGPAIVGRFLAGVPSLGVIVCALTLTTAGYAPAGILQWPARLGAAPLAAVVVLGVACTGVAFLVMFALIAEVGPVRETLVTYLNPAVAVALGVGFLGEAFTWATGVGFCLILGGSWLVLRRPAPAASGPTLTLESRSS
ncbi:EamA family transporter [Acidimicrobiaceae bacterium USS-CC1]|uniref:EamA family transporter n=1 Tax=Acidiferrimicrobium australe TaxID=2664430 RepID=A0ABW9QV03_9ACTN|nr:EamA family transporter [Acidiferrimicrobium australe]